MTPSDRILTLEQQRDELLAAAKNLMQWCERNAITDTHAALVALGSRLGAIRAAIANAEEKK